MAFGFTAPNQDVTTCDTPSNVQKTASSSGSISFDWDATSGAIEYKLYYVKEGSLPSSYFYTSNTDYTFSSLPAGNYSFYFATVCDGSISSFIVIEDHIM